MHDTHQDILQVYWDMCTHMCIWVYPDNTNCSKAEFNSQKYIRTYSTAQYVCGMGLTEHIFILHLCKHACAHKIDDVKPIIQSSRRHVHNSLQIHGCKSGMHTPNMHFGVHANSKPMTVV